MSRGRRPQDLGRLRRRRRLRVPRARSGSRSRARSRGGSVRERRCTSSASTTSRPASGGRRSRRAAARRARRRPPRPTGSSSETVVRRSCCRLDVVGRPLERLRRPPPRSGSRPSSAASSRSSRSSRRRRWPDLLGEPDRAALVADRAADRLADPDRRVGGEAVALAVVELLDRADQPERALLDQIGEREPVAGALEALGDVDDEPQVGLDHARPSPPGRRARPAARAAAPRAGVSSGVRAIWLRKREPWARRDHGAVTLVRRIPQEARAARDGYKAQRQAAARRLMRT